MNVVWVFVFESLVLYTHKHERIVIIVTIIIFYYFFPDFLFKKFLLNLNFELICNKYIFLQKHLLSKERKI